jgi:hypothetical protein
MLQDSLASWRSLGLALGKESQHITELTHQGHTCATIKGVYYWVAITGIIVFSITPPLL